MSVLTPEGYLPLSDAISEIARQIGGDVMSERKPEALIRLETAITAAIARSKAVSVAPMGSLRAPRQGAIIPVGPPPTTEQIASLAAEFAEARAQWLPIAERQQRALEEARRRLRIELAEGRLMAIAITDNGHFKNVASAPWRVADGEKAMALGRLVAPASSNVPDWPVFIPEQAFRAWLRPPTKERVSDEVLAAIVAGMAEKIAHETGQKVAQGKIEAELLAADFTGAEARRGAKMIPPHLARGRGDHDRAPLSRVAVKKSP